MSTTEIVAVIGAVLGGPAAVGAVRAWERVQLKRVEAEDESDEHADCRREVAQVRQRLDDQSQEVSTLRTAVDKCETKHAIALAKVDALDTLVHILVREVRGHDTDPPPNPAE